MPRKQKKRPVTPRPIAPVEARKAERATLVIPHRNDPEWLAWTVENAKRAGFSTVIQIEDEPAVGVSFRRDEGIMQAKTEVVMVADAHQDFMPGLSDAVCDHLDQHPRDVLCVACWGIEEREGHRVNEPGPRYGAYMHEWFEGKALVNKWHREPTDTGEVACVLGGFYAFRRDWYVDGLGRPWQYQRGWGKSEQMLSLSNWLMGGRNVCRADLWASHHFRATRTDTVNVCRAQKYNTCFIAHAMIEPDHRKRVLGLIAGGTPAEWYGCGLTFTQEEAEAYYAHVEKHRVRTYSDFREQMMHPNP